MPQLSRREFSALAVSTAAAPFAFSQPSFATAAITAQDLVDRIKAQIGVTWKADTVDGVKAGDPATVVTGVATTALATLSVLQHAVKAGANVVISSEPAFYARADSRTPPAGRGGRGALPPETPPPADRVFAGKNAYIDEHKLVIVRLNEHWRMRQPDPFTQGLAAALGWTKYQTADDARRLDVPEQALQSLVRSIEKQLRSRGGVRVIGDPRAAIRRIGLLAGSTPIQASLGMLPNVDAVIAGEVREWESVEYARDTLAAGEKKALVLVGRIVSEEPGMDACAAWLKTLAPNVPIRHIAAGDPYWRPA